MSVRASLLWVNAGHPALRDRTREEFERGCAVYDTTPSDLPSAGAARSWDLLCFDFDYPEMSDLKLLTESKQRWPSMPIIMLTLQKSADLATWALRARVYDLLLKPAPAGEVEACLARVGGALRAKRAQPARDPYAANVALPPESRYRAQLPANPRLQLAVAYVAKNFARPIPESEVARLCSLSPSRFCREFKAAFGLTFVEYLSYHRVLEGKRLLANPEMSVTDVAAAIGFADPSYFARVFRKQEGMTPSEYRVATQRAEDALKAEPLLAAPG